MTSADADRGIRWSWGTVAWLVIAVFFVGFMLSWIGIGGGVAHSTDTDDADLAYLSVVLAYLLGGLFVLLTLLVGLIRRLRSPALIALAVADLGVGLWWIQAAWPGDPACLMGCGSGGQHGVIPTVTTVLLWMTAAIHVVTAPVFAFGLRRPQS